jgi:hypothetical protein
MNKRRLLDNLHLKPGMQPDLTGDEPVYGVLFVAAAILLASLCEIVPPSWAQPPRPATGLSWEPSAVADGPVSSQHKSSAGPSSSVPSFWLAHGPAVQPRHRALRLGLKPIAWA